MGFDFVLRLLIIVLTIGSFVPQYYKILTNRNHQGISINYPLLNTIVATQQFALGLNSTVNIDRFRQYPPTPSEWLNFVQFLVVWICQTILFALIFNFPPVSTIPKWRALLIHLAACTIVFGLLIAEPMIAFLHYISDNRLLASLFASLHVFALNPLAMILSFIAFIPQVNLIISDQSIESLSTWTLGLQSAIFLAAGMYWPLRYRVPIHVPKEGRNHLEYRVSWYVVGCVVAQYVIYAVGQMTLVVLVWRRMDTDEGVDEPEEDQDVDERSRLLPGDTGRE